MNKTPNHNEIENKIMETILKEIQETHKRVNRIDKEKQDKIKPFAYTSILGVCLGYLFGAIWWGSSMSMSLEYMTKELNEAGKDRWKGKDAKSANDLIQQNLNFLQGGMKIYNERLVSSNFKIDDLSSKLSKFESRLLIMENQKEYLKYDNK